MWGTSGFTCSDTTLSGAGMSRCPWLSGMGICARITGLQCDSSVWTESLPSVHHHWHVRHDHRWVALCHGFRQRNLLAGPVPIKPAFLRFIHHFFKLPLNVMDSLWLLSLFGHGRILLEVRSSMDCGLDYATGYTLTALFQCFEWAQ